MLLQRMNGPSINQFRNELDKLITGTLGGFPEGFGGHWMNRFPALNVWQDEANVFTEAEVPGMALDELEVFVQGDQLTIKGESKAESKHDGEFTTRERVERKFCRTVQLPIAVDAENVTASLKDGVLTVTMPKAQDVLPKRIEVKG